MHIKLGKYKIAWYQLLIAAVIIGEALLFLILGEHSYIAVHDNLDLFVTHFKMLKDGDAFFAHGVDLPLLGGISRDNFASEFSLYNMLYMLLPTYYAYVAGYILKIILGLVSFTLLAKDIYGESYSEYKSIAALCGLAFGLLAVFPAYSFAFASIPLVVLLFRKIYSTPALKWYVLLFLYPLLSYFSYFGLFILGYAVVAFFVLWIKDKKFPRSVLSGIVVLSLGYVIFEYRLFMQMLLDDTETLRKTMVMASLSPSEIVAWIWEAFLKGMFHADSAHMKWVLPVCGVYFIVHNIFLIKGTAADNGQALSLAARFKTAIKRILCDPFNLIMLFIIANAAIYGLYYQEALRTFVETIIPPLKGWQFNRTLFFNPFLWYAAFFFVLKALYDSRKRYTKLLANLAVLIALVVITMTPARYNDFYHTCYSYAYKLIKGAPVNALTYQEFYSEELFEEIKRDINYNAEKSVAYGMHPAVLEYNGITTLDGYLGFYSLEYKEAFRKIVAPALERSEAWRINFDNWGARAYIFPGNDADNSWQPVANYTLSDSNLYIDADAFRALDGEYIFSRFELANADALSLSLTGTYTHESSPYTIYLYHAMN